MRVADLRRPQSAGDGRGRADRHPNGRV